MRSLVCVGRPGVVFSRTCFLVRGNVFAERIVAEFFCGIAERVGTVFATLAFVNIEDKLPKSSFLFVCDCVLSDVDSVVPVVF